MSPNFVAKAKFYVFKMKPESWKMSMHNLHISSYNVCNPGERKVFLEWFQEEKQAKMRPTDMTAKNFQQRTL